MFGKIAFISVNDGRKRVLHGVDIPGFCPHQDRFRHTAGNIVHFQLFIKWVKKSIGDWFQRIYLFQIGG